MRRPVLEERLAQISTHRLTTVVAGPGFGKTTLLAAWASRHHHSWYTLDARDRAVGSFLPRLVDALRGLAPGLPAHLLKETGQGTEEDPGRIEAIAGLLGEGLESELRDSAVLMLDDVHAVLRSPSARLLGAVCRLAPPALRVVLASRSEPPFRIERFRGRGEVLTIGASELTFSVEEVADVLGSSLGRAAASLGPALHEVTGGWPAAIRLALEALRGIPPAEHSRALEAIRHPEGPVFSYLAEEVFAREPRAVRDLVRRLAVFARFTASLGTAVGVNRAEPTLADLARRGLFVERRTEGRETWYSLHGLVRDFALRTWPLPPGEVEEIHRRAARWLEERGHVDEALRSLAAAGDHAGLARLLMERGDELIAGGRAHRVLSMVELLPPRTRSRRIHRITGQAHAARGELRQALECFRFAAGAEGAISPDLAWRMVMAHHFLDELEEGLRVFDRAVLHGADPAAEALLMSWAASCHMRLGNWEACRRLGRQALVVAEASGDLRALAAAHTVLAFGQGTDEPRGHWEPHLERALQAAEQAGDVLQIIRIRNNRGSILLETGRFRASVPELDEALRLAELAGAAKHQALALLNRGLAHYCMGDLDRAASDYQVSLAIYQRIGSGESCYPLIGLGDVHRERGNLALSRTYYEQGLALAEASGDRQGLIPGLYQQAKVLVETDPATALAMAKRAASYGWPDYPWATNAVGWISLARGDRDGAMRAGEEAGRAARRQNDLWALADSMALRALASPSPAAERPLLEEALRLYRDMGCEIRQAEIELAIGRLTGGASGRAAGRRAERRLEERGVHRSAAGAAGVLWAIHREEEEPVAVETLGRFRVTRHGRPIPREDWQSKKARDLLKVLIARRGRPVPREFLLEILWPEEDPAKTSNRLAVALATVRSVLDPERASPSDRFVQGDRESVWVDVATLSIDVEEFLADARAGLSALQEGRVAEALELLESAADRYAGDFLEENLYEDWAAPLREEARAVAIQVSRALARAAAEAGHHEAAARHFLRVLERDQYDEGAHLELVATLERAARHGEARRRYRSYVERMRELDVEAAPFPAIATV